MLELQQFFEAQTWAYYATIISLGLCVGSFLNVVIYRLPVMMDRDWRLQCHEFLKLAAPDLDHKIRHMNLSTPASTCPKCQHKIRPWENIPVISYLFLRGRCSSCNNPISLRYPSIELITGLMSLAVAMKFGISMATLAGLFLTWALVALTMIDYDTQYLPDDITLPLMWAGIVIAMFGIFTDLRSSVLGAVCGYMVLWLVFQVFKLVTKKEGMGFGDFKLLAALGAWLGWELLPQIILLSSVVGAVVGITLLVSGKTSRQQTIPFGPYLATAGWIALMWGQEINTLYLTTLP